MNRINRLRTLCTMALLAVGLVGHNSLMAQSGYDPAYGPQSGYGTQPGYDDQSGYGDPYNNQYGAQPGYGVNPQTFYNELMPYGQWVPNPTYGQVWIPNAGPGFQPYATNGHWVVTEYGNTWVSDYPWGWAPFHYGRWYQDPYYGWAWVPGSEWGPAWVSWRSGGGYYGWAPLGPGMGISVNINLPLNYWTFVPQIYITSPQIYSYYVPGIRFGNFRSTTIINNVYRYNNRAYVYGPRREEIERYTRSSVPVYRLDNLGRPGRAVVGNGSLGIYRPEMAGGGRGAGRPNWADASRGPTNNRGNNGGGFAPDRGNSVNPNPGGAGRTNRDQYNGDFGNNATPANPRADRGNSGGGFTPNSPSGNPFGNSNDSRNGDSRNGDSRNGGGWNSSRSGDSRSGDSRSGDSRSGDSRSGDSQNGGFQNGGFQNHQPRADRQDNPFGNGGGQSPTFNRQGMGGEGGQPRMQQGGQSSAPQQSQGQRAERQGGFQGGGGRGPR